MLLFAIPFGPNYNDHDITGTYAKDGDLHKRDKQVLNPEDKVRKDAFHTLTLMKAGESIAQSHWPEQSLSWFKQCKPYDPSKKPKIEVQASLSTQDEAAEAAEHTIFAYFDDDPDVLYDGGTRENGEIIGQIPLSENYEQEGVSITSWNMYNYFDYVIDNPKSKIVFDNYVIQADDPAYIVLVPNYEKHSVKGLTRGMRV